MPIHEYECPKCGVFEVFEKQDENPEGKPIKCLNPGCGRKARRLISAAAFHLKGSGWYKTDYGGNGSNGSNGTGGAEKTEKKEKKGGVSNEIKSGECTGSPSCTACSSNPDSE